MRNTVITGILLTAMAVGGSLSAQTSADEVGQLKQRIDQLEKQVQEISRLVEPLKAQQAGDSRRKGLREKFNEKMARDQQKYTREQLREAEQLYQVANQNGELPRRPRACKR